MIRIRSLNSADLEVGQRLSRQAGWNQTPADWRRLFELQPDGGFVALWNDMSAGTIMTTLFGEVAWISMVLVDESLRGRGIGEALVRHAIDVLDKRQIKTIRLDATPLGQPLYRSLGFVEQFELARYAGVYRSREEFKGRDRQGAEQLNDALAAFDQSVTATDRRDLLLRLFSEYPHNVHYIENQDRIAGYLTARPGALAIQIGPCCAEADAGPMLLANAFERFAGQPVFVDIPVANKAACQLAEVHELTIQRRFTRMSRGEALMERIENLWASSGPEKG